MNIIFMGTPDFAVPCLEKLIKNKHNILAVYSQPDKPVGRKQILTPPPVKQCALDNGLVVNQPTTFKDEAEIDKIRSYNADLIVVVAYGKLLPKGVLEAAKFGCINVHASLLPKYRGAAPIQWAVLNGDKETGVTIMQMDEGLDTGDMLMIEKTEIGENETSEELFDRLSVLGSDLLIKAVDGIKNGTVSAVKQPEGDFGYAQKITKSMCPIDWSKPANEVHNLVRGLQTWPCATTVINGKTVKIHKTILSENVGKNIGEIVNNKKVLTVYCGDGKCVDILEIQPEGKKKMDINSYLAGNSLELGAIIGE